MRLTSGFICTVLFLYYEYLSKPVFFTAVNFCLSGDTPFQSLCVRMGVTYPDSPPSLADLNEFRNRILDPAVYTWIQTGSDEWSRLTEIGTVYRNSLKGTAFEAKRDPGPPRWGDGILPHV